MKRQAAANVTPVRQRTQFSCMATSMMMCLRATGTDTNEDEVNRVMGARPMQGATWEDAIACAQHYGKRVTLICPATVRQLKEFTDRGIPLMIAWNPEGRDWSHASVVFDVDDDLNVHVADPNIPDPDETVRVMPKGEFYKKWFEKWPNYLVRRPAMAVEPEISQDGRQMVASVQKQGKSLMGRILQKSFSDAYDPRVLERYLQMADESLIPRLGVNVNNRAKDILKGEYRRLPDKRAIKRFNELGAGIDERLVERARKIEPDNPAQPRGRERSRMTPPKNVPSDVAMFFGLPPYDEASNIDFRDGYSMVALKRKYKVRDSDELARKFGISPGEVQKAWDDMQRAYSRSRSASECSPSNEPMPDSEQEIARWYARATEELHQAMLNVLGAVTAASAARRLPVGRPFDMFVDGADEEYPFDEDIDEMVRRTGSWRDDVRAKFDTWWSGCYQRPSTVTGASRVAARFIGRKARKS